MREFAFPGTKARYNPDRQFRVKELSLTVELDFAEKRIIGRARLSLDAILPETKLLRLDAVEFTITEIISESKHLPFSYDGKEILIDTSSCKRDDTFVVEIAYTAQPRRGLYFLHPDRDYPERPTQVWTQGQDEDSRYWFPCIDAPNEKAATELIAIVPADYLALSNGTLVTEPVAIASGRKKFHWRLSTPHSCYLVSLVAGQFATLTDKWRNVELAYYGPVGLEETIRRTLERTPNMMETFSRIFATPYPFERYAQVFVSDFIFGGMENTTATTLTDSVLFDARAAQDYDADALIAHELAHQWFGDLITCRHWSEAWLHEGFATYAEYLWREAYAGRDEADVEAEAWLDLYFEEDSERYRRVVATNQYHEPIDIFDCHLYEKSGRIVHMLRHELGDVLFTKVISHYLAKHKQGSVDSDDLNVAIFDVTGRNFDEFFAQWVTQKAGHPELEVTPSWEPEKKHVELTVEQVQTVNALTPLFTFSLVVDIQYDEQWTRHVLRIHDKQHTFGIPCPGKPQTIVVDPGKVLLARIKCKASTWLWSAQLKRATLAIDRKDACRALGKIGSPHAMEALAEALSQDRFWGVRGTAAAQLASFRSEKAKQLLFSALETESHPKARRAILRALGDFKREVDVATRLIEIVQSGESSYYSQGEALHSLGKTRDLRAFDILSSHVSVPSFSHVIAQNALRGIAACRDPRAAGFLSEHCRRGLPSPVRRAAISGLCQLNAHRKDASAHEACELICDLLRDRDFRVQIAAVEGLETLADTAACDALSEAAARELDGRIKRRAKEVVAKLQNTTQLSDSIQQFRDELELLRAELTRVKYQVDTPAPGQITIPTAARAKKKRAQNQRGKSAPKKQKAKPQTKTPGSRKGRAKPVR